MPLVRRSVSVALKTAFNPFFVGLPEIHNRSGRLTRQSLLGRGANVAKFLVSPA
jgi:hypothetical protein